MPNYSRYKSSITNNTRVFSIMNGLAPRSYSGRINSRATKKLVIPADPEEGLEYMKKHNILSKNPACSGGVGRINTTACTSKDGLFMSVAPRNYQYRPLYNHIYKSNDTTTHHLPCDLRLFPHSPGVTVGKISDQGFYASGVPKVDENMFMCDISSNNPEPCTTDLSHVYAFNIYSDPRNRRQNKVTTDCSHNHWQERIEKCHSEGVCAQQVPASTITIEDASGLVGILAILSIDEYFKPIAFTRIDLSGTWEIPEISMNIYYPTTLIDPGQPYFNILPGADIKNKAHITVMHNYLHTTLFQIAGSFTNYGIIKYASNTIIGIRDITFFDISGSEGKLTNASSGNIIIPDISGSPTTRSIKIFNAANGATIFNNGGKIEVGNITTSTSPPIRIFNILNESTLKNGGNILINKIDNSGSGFYFEESFFKHTSGEIVINKITNKSVGIKLTNSQLSNEASILIGDISNESYGLFADNSPITNKREIKIGTIDNSSSGFFADNSPITNTSDMYLGEIQDSTGFHLTNGSTLLNHNNITLGTIDNSSSGFFADNSPITNTSDMYLGEIQDSTGFHLTNGSTLLNHNNITLGNISDNGTGIQFTTASTLSNDGPITLGNINNGSSGFFVDTSELTNTSDISLGAIQDGTGFHLTNSSTLLNNNNITLGNISDNGMGIQFTGTSTLSNDGPITLGTIDNSSSGFFAENSELTNHHDITFGVIQDSTGFHLTNGSNLTNKSNINFDTINGIYVESVGLFRDASSSIINNTSILFTEISGKAVGVVAEIHSILPHEIMGGYGKIDVSNINYQDKTNPYTYAFGKRGIALTRALMDNAVEFKKNEPDSSSNYCPSSHPYAYMEFENQVYGFKENEISNDLNGTLKSKCCSVQPSVSGISNNWSGLNRKATTGIDYSDFDAANLSAVRQLATDVGTCGGEHANYAGWSANGAFSFRHVCPEGASHDPNSSSLSTNTLQSMPGIPQAQIFSTKTMYSQEMGTCEHIGSIFHTAYCNKSFYSFGYGWKDLKYSDAWNELKPNNLNKGDTLQANEKVYYLDIVNGTPFADDQDPHTTWLIQDFVGSADIECATACKKEDGCTSYSLIPTEIDGSGGYVTIQYYCVGRSDGYTDYKGVQGWGGVVPASLSNGASLPENWNARSASKGKSTDRTNYHYAQWCDATGGTNWRPRYAPLAPLVGFVKKPPQVAPIINFNGSVNIEDGRGDDNQEAAVTQYNALKNVSGIEKWCDKSATKNEFKNFKTMTEDEPIRGAEEMEKACLMGSGCWDPDPDFGGCYEPSERNDGGVLSLEKMPAEIYPNKGKAEVDSKSEQGKWTWTDEDPPPSEWLMNTRHEITPVTHTTDKRPDINDIKEQITPYE